MQLAKFVHNDMNETSKLIQINKFVTHAVLYTWTPINALPPGVVIFDKVNKVNNIKS